MSHLWLEQVIQEKEHCPCLRRSFSELLVKEKIELFIGNVLAHFSLPVKYPYID